MEVHIEANRCELKGAHGLEAWLSEFPLDEVHKGPVREADALGLAWGTEAEIKVRVGLGPEAETQLRVVVRAE